MDHKINNNTNKWRYKNLLPSRFPRKWIRNEQISKGDFFFLLCLRVSLTFKFATLCVPFKRRANYVTFNPPEVTGGIFLFFSFLSPRQRAFPQRVIFSGAWNGERRRKTKRTEEARVYGKRW